MALTIFLIVFVLLLFSGLPVYVAMVVPSLIYAFMSPQLTFSIVCQKMLTSMNSFTLMAVPFFILAGNIMSQGSVSRRIFDFCDRIIGHHRGGLGYVNILASVVFSGMSGSALADVGGLGQVEIKEMRAAGYDDDFTIGVTAASGTIGPIIPPSIPFVVFSSYTAVSVGALFFGGVVPGLIMATVLGVWVYVISKKRNYPSRKRSSGKELWGSFKNSWLSLLVVVIILGGIWFGFFTPTEAAIVASVYAICITAFVYKDLTWKKFWDMLVSTVMGTVPIMMIILGATVFSWIITYEKLDQLVLNALVSFTSNKYVVLLLICVFVTIMGMFFDSVVTVLLIAPILIPICSTYGFNMIHLGVVITLGNVIALCTPPVGMSLYTLQSVTGLSFKQVTKYVFTWLWPMIISWIIVALWEPFTLFIPRLMGIA